VELQKRRSVVYTLGILLTGGCTQSTEEPPNKSTIINISQANRTEADGTLSAHGYVKFIERPESDELIIQQTLVDAGSSCDSSNIDVNPNSGATNGRSIKIDIKPKKDQIKKKCISSVDKPTGVAIKFKSLNSGQEVKLKYDSITASYITTGRKNTVAREPGSVPVGVRTYIG
jgi:hypothetical protein